MDGAELLDRVHAALTRYVVLPSPDAAVAVVLWIAATHAQPAWAHAPRLVIRAPEKRCGKSRLLDVVEATCHDPLITVNASPAAVYRAIGTDDPPTLLVDEADTIFGAEGRRGQRRPARPAQRRPPAQPARDPLRRRHQPRGAASPPSPWPRSPASAPCPTPSRTAPSSSGCAAAPPARPSPRTGTAATGPPCRSSPASCTAWLRAPPRPTLEQRRAGHAASKTGPPTPGNPSSPSPTSPAGDWPDRARAAAVAARPPRPTTTAEASDRVRLLADCRAAFGDLDAMPTADPARTAARPTPKRPGPTTAPTGLTADEARRPARASTTSAPPTSASPNRGQAKGYLRADFADAWSRYCPASDRDPPTGRRPAAQPSPAGVAVPAVPSVPAQLRPGTARTAGTDQAVPPATLGRINRPTLPSRPGADLRRDAWDGWDGTPPAPCDRRGQATRPHERLTLAEVCAELRISRSTFYESRAKGRAPRCIKLPN